MENSIQPQRWGKLAILILAINAILLSSLTACGSNTPATQFTTALPTSLGDHNIEEKSKTPTTTPTITKTPTLTKTPIKTKKYQWTSTPITPSPTKAPLTSYYDKEFGIHISYPINWVKTADRTFIGEGGYLILSKLEGYHSPDWCHVAIDVANTLYSQYHPNVGCLGWGPNTRAIAMNGPDPSGKTTFKIIGVYPYHITQDSANFFTIETTDLYYLEIVKSIIWDENLFPPTPTKSPAGTPNPTFIDDPDGISIVEVTSYGYGYMLQTKIGDNNCGLGNESENQKFDFTVVDSDRILILKDDQTVFEFASWVFNEPIPSSFCTSGDFWMMETRGFTVINGEILNHSLGFDEVFGWHLLSGKPLFFAKQGNEYIISYNGKILPVKYNYIAHYLCCAWSGDNPATDGKKTWFWAERDGVTYLVMLRTK